MGLKSRIIHLARQFPFILPFKIINSCREWIDKNGKQKGIYYSQRGPWHKTIFPKGLVNNDEPRTIGTPSPMSFYHHRSYSTNEASLFYLQNCYLVGQKGFVLTANNCLFQEFSHNFSLSSLKVFLRRNPFSTFSVNVRHVNGIVAVLTSPESYNYYHWLNDVLPRIRLYEPVITQIDYFCIASAVPDKFIAILKYWGIPTEKVLIIGENEKLHIDHLYVSSLPGSEGRSPKWALDYLRDKFIGPSPAGSPFRKLYFRRGVSTGRKILNEDSVIKNLVQCDFEIIDPGILTIEQQVEMMQQAKIVVSAHGGALSNLLFSQDNTAVIEIFSPDYFRTDCYYTLSSIRHLNYWYIIGDKPAGALWGDIKIPEDLLFKTIQQINP
jgi:hypothetical protein